MANPGLRCTESNQPNQHTMKNILVLGGTGFVGRHVCEKLHRMGWRITVPTRRALNAAAVTPLARMSARVTDRSRLAKRFPCSSSSRRWWR